MSVLRSRRTARRNSACAFPVLSSVATRNFEAINSVQAVLDCVEHAIAELPDAFDLHDIEPEDLKKFMQIILEGANIFQEHSSLLWRLGESVAIFFKKALMFYHFSKKNLSLKCFELAQKSVAGLLCSVQLHELNKQLLLNKDIIVFLYEYVLLLHDQPNWQTKDRSESQQLKLALQSLSSTLKNGAFACCISESKNEELFKAAALFLWNSSSERKVVELASDESFLNFICERFLHLSEYSESSNDGLTRKMLLLNLFANVGSSSISVRDHILLSHPKFLHHSFKMFQSLSNEYLVTKTEFSKQMLYLSFDNLINLTNQSYIVSEILENMMNNHFEFQQLVDFAEHALDSEDFDLKIYSLCLLSNLFEYSSSLSIHIISSGGKLLDKMNSLAYSIHKTDQQHSLALHSSLCIAFLLDAHFDIFKCNVLLFFIL
jgi:hypothetical protein